MAVRERVDSDDAELLAMARSLWPESALDDLRDERVWVWERPDGGLGGFVSMSVRPWADGCDSQPCPHVEGWWVAPDLRQQGVGRELIGAVETWARENGFRELGSDTEIDNVVGLVAHEALGFEPTERIQCFRKWL